MSPTFPSNQIEICRSVFVIERGCTAPTYIENHFPDLRKGTVADLERTLRKGQKPSIVLLVIGTKVHDGLKILMRIRKQSPDLAVVVLSARHSLECSEACANLSTQGYYVMPYDRFELCEKIKSLILAKDEERAGISKKQVLDSTIRKALEYISKNCHLSISSKDVADHVCLSRNHFSEKFKKETGNTPSGQIRLARVARAKRLILQDPSLKLGDVAERIGYSDVYHFSRTFKHCTSQSPSEFRKAACLEFWENGSPS